MEDVNLKKKSKEEIVEENFGLEKPEKTHRERVKEQAESLYLDSFGMLDFSGSSLQKVKEILKGLIRFQTTEAATYAITDGTAFNKTGLWKISFFTAFPSSLLFFVAFFFGALSGNDDGFSVILTLGFGFLLFAFVTALMTLTTWLSIIIVAETTNFFSNLFFKTKSPRHPFRLLVGYWFFLFTMVPFIIQSVGILLSLSLPFIGSIIYFAIQIAAFVVMLVSYHKSMAFALGVNTKRTFLISLILFAIIFIITFFVSYLFV